MLIENMEAKAIGIGAGFFLIPGINRIDDDQWRAVSTNPKWAGPIDGMVEDGRIELTQPSEKLSKALIDKTFDASLLSEWLADSKHTGVIRGALRKQLDKVKVTEDVL